MIALLALRKGYQLRAGLSMKTEGETLSEKKVFPFPPAYGILTAKSVIRQFSAYVSAGGLSGFYSVYK
jgi:hypothetical protein